MFTEAENIFFVGSRYDRINRESFPKSSQLKCKNIQLRANIFGCIRISHMQSSTISNDFQDRYGFITQYS